MTSLKRAAKETRVHRYVEFFLQCSTSEHSE